MAEHVERQLTIINELGMHARAAAVFVKAAVRFEADIVVERKGTEVNGKSIMGILMLNATQGTTITVRAAGADAGPAVDALAALVADRFGEER